MMSQVFKTIGTSCPQPLDPDLPEQASEQSYTDPNSRFSAQFYRDCTYQVDLTRKSSSLKYFFPPCFLTPMQSSTSSDLPATTMKACLIAQSSSRSTQLSSSSIPMLLSSCKFGTKRRRRSTRKSYQVRIDFDTVGEVQAWQVCYQYFLYKPEEPHEDSSYIHMVNLDKENSTYLIDVSRLSMKKSTFLIQTYLVAYLSYVDGYLIMADYSEIKILPLKDELEKGGKIIKLEPQPSDFLTIEPQKTTIHGIYVTKASFEASQVFVCLETVDNQIDFNLLCIQDSNPNCFKYVFKQQRDIVRRNASFDQIVKFRGVFDRNDMFYGVAQRQSRLIDFYYNQQRTTSDDTPAVDIDINFARIFYKDMQGKNYTLLLSLKSELSVENATIEERVKFSNIYFQKIKNYGKIRVIDCLVNHYSSYTATGKNLVLVSHGKIISFFNFQINQWINHKAYESEVATICRQKKGARDYILIIVLTNGQVFETKVKTEGEEEERLNFLRDDLISLSKEPSQNANQEIVFFSKERETNSHFLIHTKDMEDPLKANLFLITGGQSYDLTPGILDFNGKKNYNNLIAQCTSCFMYLTAERDPTAQFIVQNGKYISFYRINMNNETPTALMLMKPMLFENVIGVVHTVLRSKDRRCIIMVDNLNFYKYVFETQAITVFKGTIFPFILWLDQNCIGAYLCDKSYLYTFSNASQLSADRPEPGFRVYDIDNIVNKDKDYSYLLTQNVYVGCQGHIDYSFFNQRLLIMSSYDNLEIVPFLHRNSMNFLGMAQRKDDYFAIRQMGNKVIGLDKTGKTTTWNVFTGKKIVNEEQQRYRNEEFAAYDIFACDEQDKTYQKGWFDRVLIKKKKPVEGVIDDNMYFDPNKYSASYIEGQESFVKQQKKAYYEFQLIEILGPNSVAQHLKFTHPVYDPSTGVQFIYFSEDKNFMFERLANSRQFLYERQDLQDGNVRWNMIHRFKNLPSELMQDPKLSSQFPFYLSPNFQKFLDINRKTNTFVIRSSLSQEEQVLYEIPASILKCTPQTIAIEGSKLRWMSNEIIKVFNNEGLERLLDMTLNFSEVGYNMIPMFDPAVPQTLNYNYDRPVLSNQSTLDIYKRKVQAYKNRYFTAGDEIKNEINLDQVELSTITMGQGNQEKFVSKQSFSFLHWKIIEMLATDRIKIEQIEEGQIEMLLYTILPGGDTVFHRVYQKPEIIDEIMKIAHPIVAKELSIRYYVPFLNNHEGENVISLLAKDQEFGAINKLLEYLSLYGIDHHSRNLTPLMPKIIGKTISNLIPYLESRILQPMDLQGVIFRGTINSDQEAKAVCSPLIVGEATKNKLFDPIVENQDILLSVLDIPQMHEYNNETSLEFFKSLDETENFALFETRAIKRLIEFKWPLAFWNIVLKLLIPFLLFMALYLTYMNRFYNGRLDKPVMTYWFMAILTGFCIWYLYSESKQCMKDGPSYFLSIWNYLDIGPPILLITFFALQLAGLFDELTPTVILDVNGNEIIHYSRTYADIEATLQATMSLMIWMKLLYFLRIFQSTGYLVRMIVEVIVDMRYFLLVLLLTFIAFGDALYSINTSNDSVNYFTGDTWVGAVMYVYRMVLGDFQIDSIGTVSTNYVRILFLLCTVFNMIIMLNLLIAIISESFGKINSISNQTSYQEMASMIAENTRFITNFSQRRYCKPNQYLVIASDASAESLGSSDMGELFRGLQKQLSIQMEEMQTRINGRVQQIQQQAETNRKDNQKILSDLQEIKGKLNK